jgi:hypothetical protein
MMVLVNFLALTGKMSGIPIFLVGKLFHCQKFSYPGANFFHMRINAGLYTNPEHTFSKILKLSKHIDIA